MATVPGRADPGRERVGRASDPQRAAERPGGVVRRRAVVIHEHVAVAAIGEKRAAESPDVGRRLQPARRLRIEFSKVLQRPVLRFREQLDAHGGRQIDGVVFRLERLSRVLRRTVVAGAPAALRTLRRTIAEDVLAGLRVVTDDIGLAAGLLHFVKRPELLGPCAQPGLHSVPVEALVAVHVLFETGFQRSEQ